MGPRTIISWVLTGITVIALVELFKGQGSLLHQQIMHLSHAVMAAVFG